MQKGLVMIGNFDGIHLGHQAILKKGREQATHEGRAFVVLTFHPHPKAFFNADIPPFRLTKLEDKLKILEDLGVDGVVVYEFNHEASQKSAQAFINETLVRDVKAAHIMVGRNFIFGYKRSGNIETLEAAAADGKFAVSILDLERDSEDKHYSSTRIRNFLRNGEPKEAAKLLGRPWAIHGIVQEGDKHGRKIGIPTANLSLSDYLRPLYGVYGVQVKLSGENISRPGIANIGVRPTVGGLKEMLEVHLFDFDGDLYGKPLHVELLDFIREERKFENLEALKAQIHHDIETVKQKLNS